MSETKAAMKLNASARRAHNLEIALKLARRGIAVFPSSGKVPLVSGWQRLDSDLSKDERKAIAAKHSERNGGKSPLHVGATVDPITIKRLHRLVPDAEWSISCGPAGLVVIDADSKHDGPRKIRKLFEHNGESIPPTAPLTHTRSGGLHIVYRNEGNLGSKAGRLKEYGCDVRGMGGQIVAPGSVLQDGREYMPDAEHAQLWLGVENLPTLPDFIAATIGTPAPEKVTSLSDERREREAIRELQESDWPDYDSLFGELGEYDLDALKAKDSRFAEVMDDPSADCSKNRFDVARGLLREYPDMPVTHLATFLSEWGGAGAFVDDRPAAGEFDLRQIAREWLRNQGVLPISDGSAFGVVPDEDDDAPEQTKSRTGFTLEALDDLDAESEPVEWLVKNYLEQGITGVFFGAPGQGKTAALLDLSLKVAHGLPWHGRKTTKAGVLYVIQEGRAGAKRRVRAWLKHATEAGLDVGGGAFLMVRQPVDLFNSDRDLKRIIEAAKEFPTRFGARCGMVIVDTLAQAMPGGDENSARDVGVVTKRLDRLRDATGAAAFLIHHTGKDATRGARGSTASLGNVDVCIAIQSHAFRADVDGTKLREGDPAQRFTFDLRTVVAGRDADGDAVTTVVAVEAAPAEAPMFPAVEIEDDAPTLAPADTGEARKQQVLALYEAEARRQKPSDANAASARRALELQTGELVRAWNAVRKADGLSVLHRATAQGTIRAMLADGTLTAVGPKARPAYRLSGPRDGEELDC